MSMAEGFRLDYESAEFVGPTSHMSSKLDGSRDNRESAEFSGYYLTYLGSFENVCPFNGRPLIQNANFHAYSARKPLFGVRNAVRFILKWS